MDIVYHCVAGRVADTPLAVHRALLEREAAGGRRDRHTWLVDPVRGDEVPAGARTAPTDGPAAVAALERADVVLSTTHLDPGWRKRAGTLYVQAWHGTPLKRIAGDELAAVRDPATGAPLVPGADDVARWDVLLSPNRVSTARLRSAFRYDGEVVESGLPRNDALLGPGAGQRRARVRERLGLRGDQVAVLWTPTWREGGGVPDVEAFCAAFTDTVRRRPRAAAAPAPLPVGRPHRGLRHRPGRRRGGGGRHRRGGGLRPVPGRRRAGGRLLLDHRGLRGDAAPGAPARPGPGALRRGGARDVPRPGRRGPGPGAGLAAGGDGRPGRPARGGAGVGPAPRGLPRALLPPRRRPRHRSACSPCWTGCSRPGRSTCGPRPPGAPRGGAAPRRCPLERRPPPRCPAAP